MVLLLIDLYCIIRLGLCYRIDNASFLPSSTNVPKFYRTSGTQLKFSLKAVKGCQIDLLELLNYILWDT